MYYVVVPEHVLLLVAEGTAQEGEQPLHSRRRCRHERYELEALCEERQRPRLVLRLPKAN